MDLRLNPAVPVYWPTNTLHIHTHAHVHTLVAEAAMQGANLRRWYFDMQPGEQVIEPSTSQLVENSLYSLSHSLPKCQHFIDL